MKQCQNIQTGANNSSPNY